MPEIDGTALDADLKILEEAALEAGELALTYFGRDPETWFKGNKSPVSEADIAVDHFLADKLRSARPEYGWLSEETADDPVRLEHERIFIVDPIDGTRAFLAGGDEWTVSIAIVDRGRPSAGAVYCPRRQEMFLARIGGGTLLNREKISVSSKSETAGARLTGPHSIIANKGVQAAGFVAQEVQRSLAYRLAMVACGRADVGAARSGPSDWDLAAADLLVQEAGGKLTDLSGRSLMYNQPKTRHPALVAAPEQLVGPVCTVLGQLVG